MSFVGHEQPWQEWRAAMEGARMHHGWILSGRRGTGKGSFALQAARALVAEAGIPQPPGDHPDIIVLGHQPAGPEEEKKREQGKPFRLRRNITVDQVRAMQHRLTTRPTLGSRRAIIIDPADDLEKGAANALLKSLEEPPAGSYFLLVTHRIGRLLPTIRSRCRLLQFPRVDRTEIDAILQASAPQADAAMRQAAIEAAAGSPGAALDFLALDLGDMHQLMLRIARSGDPDFALRGKLADAMGARPERERQLAALDLARSVAASRMHETPMSGIPALAEAHGELLRLTAQAPTYNFDPGLLIMEIGSLLSTLAPPRDAAHG